MSGNSTKIKRTTNFIFNNNQLIHFSLSNPQWIKQYLATKPLHWTLGWSLSAQEYVYFPAAYCYANTSFDDHVFSLYNHNGNSAGNTKEEAILQGTLELIERDAVAIWWYNRIPRPEISLEIIPVEQLEIINKTLLKEWDFWLLDISSDIEVVSSVAVGRNKQTDQFVLGFGTHLCPSIACHRALTEMYQLIVVKDEVSGPFDFSTIAAHPFLFPKRKSEKRMVEYFRTITTDCM